MISKKICLVGDFGVGKTSLIRRFVDRQFSDEYLSTVGVKISRKTLELEGVRQQDQLNLQLLIWDLEGHTKFKAIAPSYLQGIRT
jgi:small GTP-binding protein